MGTCKQLLPVHDQAAVAYCLKTIRNTGVSDITVVVGPEGRDVAEAARQFPVTIAVNDLPGSDMAQSVRAGLQAIPGTSSGILICLCDHPLVLSSTIAAMIRKHQTCPEEIIIPVFRERKGHPTLFPRLILEEINRHASLRDVIGAHREKICFIHVEDEGVLLDMDTPADYRKILERC